MTEPTGAHTGFTWPPTKADVLALVLTGCLAVTILEGAWWPAVVLAVLLTAVVISPRVVQARAEGPGIVVQAEFELDDEALPAPEQRRGSLRAASPQPDPKRRSPSPPRSRRPAAG